MPSRAGLVSVSAAALALAGCGSSSSSSTTASVPPFEKTAPNLNLPLKTATYTASLAGSTGTPPGAPNASGIAVINVNPAAGQLCWQFSQLQNVPPPTVARLLIYTRGSAGTHGLALGQPYQPSGCVTEPRLLFDVLQAHPGRYWISIHTAHYPAGALRGPLQLQ